MVDHLTWRPYGRRSPVLDDVCLRIAPGERVLLVGASGSGKSTLLRAVAGLLLTADSGDLEGSVRVDGRDPQSTAGLVGLVLQDPGAGIVASSLGRDVAFGLENLGMPPAAMLAPVAAALRDVRLDVAQDVSPTTLSGGEQQRLALAGALAMSPRVLLLDEPLAMLDPVTADSVRSVVSDVARRRGLTLVVVEHRLGPWVDHVDRLVVLGDGGLPVADGPPAEVLSRQGETLVAQGIWVPGIPDPEPLAVPITWAPPAIEPGTRVASARAVTVRRTSRGLGTPQRVTVAVADADLDLRGGELTALVGPSGAGKSTLMAAIGGLIAPSAGEVVWPGIGPPPHELAPVDLARQVAWVPQRAASTLVRRTVREEVLATSLAIGVDPAVARARADVLLDGLGLSGHAATDPRHLSGGEQRRLAVAAAVVHQPPLVLADEPTVGQDRLTWAAVMGVLESVRAAGSAVLVTTHDDGVRSRATVVHTLTAPARPPETWPDHATAPQGPSRGATLSDPGMPPPSSSPPVAPSSPPAAPSSPPVAPSRPVRRSLAARCGPLSLLLVGVLVLPLPALLDSWRQALAVIAVELAIAVVALWAPGAGPRPQGRARRLLGRLAAPLFAVLAVAWSTWLLGGRDLEVAAQAGLRVLGLVLPSAIVLPFVDPDALGDHLGQRVHLPARPVVAFSAALQRFQAFGDLWSELALARRVRGIGGGRSLVARAREVGATTFGLFVGVLGQAATLALAMDSRGFSGAHRRTWAGPAPWTRWDTAAVAVGLVPTLVAVLARGH